MPAIDKVYNASLEKYEIQIFSKMFVFNPRSYTEVPDTHSWPIAREHHTKGLIIVEDGSDFKAKERQALISYLRRLDERIRNYHSELDEFRRKGAHIEKKPEHLRAERWREEIIKRLEMTAPVVEELSFLNPEHTGDEKKKKAAEAPVAPKQPKANTQEVGAHN